jgi:hypothetical protein
MNTFHHGKVDITTIKFFDYDCVPDLVEDTHGVYM